MLLNCVVEKNCERRNGGQQPNMIKRSACHGYFLSFQWSISIFAVRGRASDRRRTDGSVQRTALGCRV